MFLCRLTTFFLKELTMDTSNSTALHVRPLDLRFSEDPQDQVIAEDCKRVVGLIMEQLRPILRYMCIPMGFNGEKRAKTIRCVRVIDFVSSGVIFSAGFVLNLFLDEKGIFFLASCPKNEKPTLWNRVNGNPEEWEEAPFDELLGGLQELLRRATEKHQEHVKVTAKRTELFDKLIAVLKQG